MARPAVATGSVATGNTAMECPDGITTLAGTWRKLLLLASLIRNPFVAVTLSERVTVQFAALAAVTGFGEIVIELSLRAGGSTVIRPVTDLLEGSSAVITDWAV